MKRYFLFLLSAILLLLPQMAWTDSGKIPTINELILDWSKEKPKNKLHLDRSHPFTLSYLLDHKNFHLKQTLLVWGFRPEGDRPKKAPHVTGQKLTDRDWVLEEGTNAAWVSGVPRPTHHDPVIVMARLEGKGDSLILLASQLMKIGKDQEKRTTLRHGEYIFYPLPGSKSNTCPIELVGDSVEIVYYDEFNSVILQAMKPGVTKLKIFTLWWRDIEPKFLKEYEIVVE